MKRLVALALLWVLAAATPASAGTTGSATRWFVPVLEYHGTTCPTGKPDSITVCDSTFRDQINAVLAAGWTPITARYLARKMTDRTGLSGKRFIISIDNSTASRFTDTLPQLQDLGVRASFFVVTARMGKTGYMTWDQVRELAASGMDIENHSRTHPFMSTLGYDDQLAEITDAQDAILAQVGQPAVAYAHPYGDYDSDTLAALAAAGTVLAVSSNRGSGWVYGNHPYTINRIPAPLYPNPTDLLARMASGT